MYYIARMFKYNHKSSQMNRPTISEIYCFYALLRDQKILL